jgi:hypothetical protein
VLEQEQDASRQRREAGQLGALAADAGRNAQKYVMLTLMCAAVLFFGGISGTFQTRKVRMALACVSAALFLFNLSLLAGTPVSW